MQSLAKCYLYSTTSKPKRSSKAAAEARMLRSALKAAIKAQPTAQGRQAAAAEGKAWLKSIR